MGSIGAARAGGGGEKVFDFNNTDRFLLTMYESMSQQSSIMRTDAYKNAVMNEDIERLTALRDNAKAQAEVFVNTPAEARGGIENERDLYNQQVDVMTAADYADTYINQYNRRKGGNK